MNGRSRLGGAGRGASFRRARGGAALLLVTLLAAALTLLGLSFLVISGSEARIARNEWQAAEASQLAESALSVVRLWFDRPDARGALRPPTAAQVRRDLRVIDPDGPGPALPRPAAAGEQYKRGVDLDGDGAEDLFDRPYAGDLRDALLGTRDGPDLRLVDRPYLEALSRTLFDDAAPPGLEARVASIDLYAPPFVETSSGWVPRGVGTVELTLRLYRRAQVVAEKTVRAVIAEVPYRGPFGPLHSCAGIALRPPKHHDLGLHWGVVTAVGSVAVSDPEAVVPRSLPRSAAARPAIDPLWGEGFVAPLERFAALAAGARLHDPWFRLESGGVIAGLPGETQPRPSAWRDWDGGAAPPGIPGFDDHSNLLQGRPVPCPAYDYRTWKAIAASGAPQVRYFTWAEEDLFREDGRGEPRSLRAWTNGGEGVFFFDTRDGQPPAVDGRNLTPPVSVGPGHWTFRGLLYLNASRFQTRDLQGVPVDLRPPGEPFRDLDGDGRHQPDRDGDGARDADDEPWIDLVYPSSPGQPFEVAPFPGEPDTTAPRAVRTTASLRGILFTNGEFEATGRARHYGSVVARRGVVQRDTAPGRPEVFWDAAILADWPEAGSGLPRVWLTDWMTDP